MLHEESEILLPTVITPPIDNKPSKKTKATTTATASSKKKATVIVSSTSPIKEKAVESKKAPAPKKHYLNNAAFLEEIIKSKQIGRMTDTLARMFMLLATKTSNKSWFVGFSYRDEMVSHALVNLCANWHKFDETKYKNPHAYFTTAVMRSFSQYKSEEKKHQTIRDTLMVKNGLNPSNNFLDDAHQDYVNNHSDFYPGEL